MNYIKRLEREVRDLTADRDEAVAVINDKLRLLLSSKYHVDNTIGVQEVIQMFINVRSELVGG